MTGAAQAGPGTAVPAVPPGPGVQPPFVVAPIDGQRRRRRSAVILSIVASLVLCLGGAGGLGALIVLAERVITEQLQTAVTNYLTALQERRYDAAYDMLCGPLRQQTSQEQFVRSRRNEPQVTAFQVGEPQFTDPIIVPAWVTTDDGGTRQRRFVMQQDEQTGAVEVCGTAD